MYCKGGRGSAGIWVFFPRISEIEPDCQCRHGVSDGLDSTKWCRSKGIPYSSVQIWNHQALSCSPSNTICHQEGVKIYSKKTFKIQSQWKSLPGPEYGHKWQMRGRKHPFSYDPSMTVWSEHMREHVIICFFTLFYKENLHPTKERKAAWYVCFYCILPQILPPLWFYFHVPMRTCVSLWWSHQLSPFTAGMKCTSWEIALDMKAKTSPPLQYDQKKKEEEKKKKGAEVSISALNITVMGCLTPTLCQWALHYGSFEAICTALGFDAAGTHIHVHVLNGSGRCITNWGKFVRMQNIAVILLLQNPGWMENTGITQAWRVNDTPHPWFFSSCTYFHQCVLSIYDLPLAPERSAFMSCLFIPRRNKLQETLGSKWEVQSYPVKTIKSREARLSPHKLPEMRSAGKYAEPRRQGLVCVLCVNST